MSQDRFETGCNILGQLPLIITYKKSETPNLKTFEKIKIMLSCSHIFHNIQFSKKPAHEQKSGKASTIFAGGRMRGLGNLFLLHTVCPIVSKSSKKPELCF
jgi:hypothetical protein